MATNKIATSVTLDKDNTKKVKEILNDKGFNLSSYMNKHFIDIINDNNDLPDEMIEKVAPMVTTDPDITVEHKKIPSESEIRNEINKFNNEKEMEEQNLKLSNDNNDLKNDIENIKRVVDEHDRNFNDRVMNIMKDKSKEVKNELGIVKLNNDIVFGFRNVVKRLDDIQNR